MHNSPKVFISYSHTDEPHKEWVAKLVKDLETSGVVVVWDQKDLKLGHDIFTYMEKMVADPTIRKVLMICDEEYIRKANEGISGVGAESKIIFSEISNDPEQEKFIPVGRLKVSNDICLPTFLGKMNALDFSTQDEMNKNWSNLIRNIYEGDFQIIERKNDTEKEYDRLVDNLDISGGCYKSINMNLHHRINSFNELLKLAKNDNDYTERVFNALFIHLKNLPTKVGYNSTCHRTADIEIKTLVNDILFGYKLNGVFDGFHFNFNELRFDGYDFQSIQRSKGGLSFISANLSSADFSGTDLSNCIFSGANLERANLSNANLENANLSNVNLKNANLFNANIKNAIMSGANLENVDLSTAKNS